MEIKRVVGNKSSGAKLVYIPKNSDIVIGDFVKIIKITNEEEEMIDNI